MDFIPVNRPLLNGNELNYVQECIKSGWISSEGDFVNRFEINCARKFGRKYAVAVSSGSAAIDIAIESLNLEPGDEIILPSFSIISCIAQILRNGLKPVFIDCCRESFNILINDIEQKITNKTRAILVVHTYGLAVDMFLVQEIAKKYQLYLIEDAAEAHGQTCHGIPVGSFGDISIFSFYANKHITTGEGGMLLTNNNEIFERSKSLKNLCFETERRFKHFELGWNYRMTNIQAALGLAQIEKLNEITLSKRKIAEKYNYLLKDCKGITLPLRKNKCSENIYWVYPLVIKDNLEINADQIIKILEKKGIGSRPFFYPLHQQPVLNKYNLNKQIKLPNSEYISEKGFYIPSGLGITDDEIKKVADVIRSLF